MSSEAKPHRTPPAEAFTQLILEIFRINGQLLAAGDQLTKELGLTSALWQVLGAINEKPLPIAQIARNMGLTRQGVRRTTNVLEEKGFIEFQDNPNHQRSKLVVLTDKGRDVLDQVSALQVDWANSIASELDKEKLDEAIQTMQRIRDRL